MLARHDDDPSSRNRGPPIADAGLLLACVGCCCGRPEPGGPKTPPRTLKREMRRAHREAGLEGRVRLALTDCLGPCSEANVVFLYLDGRPRWFRRVNSVEVFAALLAWARDGHGDDAALPPALAARSFSWTGGGVGPEPPIADA
jgi:hypothetical protein